MAGTSDQLFTKKKSPFLVTRLVILYYIFAANLFSKGGLLTNSVAEAQSRRDSSILNEFERQNHQIMLLKKKSNKAEIRVEITYCLEINEKENI